VLERGLAEQDHFREALFFHRAIPPLQMRVQVWAAWRQEERLDSRGSQDLAKGGTKLGIAIVQQITATVEHSLPRHRQVSSHLLHPSSIRGEGETTDANLSRGNPHEY
jgi:hypothetical protein